MTDNHWLPDACTLPTSEQPLRLAEFDRLFGDSAQRVERVSVTRLRLHLRGPDGLADRVRDLASRENQCCSFFAFTVTPAATGDVILDVEVPDPHTDVLDALAARASAVREGR